MYGVSTNATEISAAREYPATEKIAHKLRFGCYVAHERDLLLVRVPRFFGCQRVWFHATRFFM